MALFYVLYLIAVLFKVRGPGVNQPYHLGDMTSSAPVSAAYLELV